MSAQLAPMDALNNDGLLVKILVESVVDRSSLSFGTALSALLMRDQLTLQPSALRLLEAFSSKKILGRLWRRARTKRSSLSQIGIRTTVGESHAVPFWPASIVVKKPHQNKMIQEETRVVE